MRELEDQSGKHTEHRDREMWEKDQGISGNRHTQAQSSQGRRDASGA